MDTDVLMFIAMVTGVVLVAGHVSRVLRTRHLHTTLREAIRTDSAATAALLDKLDNRSDDRGDDDRIGLVLLSLGVALVGYGWVTGEGEQAREFAGLALFPIFVGGPLLARALYLNRRAARPR